MSLVVTIFGQLPLLGLLKFSKFLNLVELLLYFQKELISLQLEVERVHWECLFMNIGILAGLLLNNYRLCWRILNLFGDFKGPASNRLLNKLVGYLNWFHLGLFSLMTDGSLLQLLVLRQNLFLWAFIVFSWGIEWFIWVNWFFLHLMKLIFFTIWLLLGLRSFAILFHILEHLGVFRLTDGLLGWHIELSEKFIYVECLKGIYFRVLFELELFLLANLECVENFMKLFVLRQKSDWFGVFNSSTLVRHVLINRSLWLILLRVLFNSLYI